MPSRPLLATIATLLLLAGCSESTQGSPIAGDGPTTATSDETTTEQTSTEQTSTGEEPTGVADLEPCDLLDQAALDGLQLTGGEAKTVGAARVCRWQRNGATLNETFTVSVELFDEQGLADLNAPDVQEMPPVGDHDAAKFTDPTGTCGVSLGVGDSSRVDNTAVGGDQQQGCQLAEQVATVVEKELP